MRASGPASDQGLRRLRPMVGAGQAVGRLLRCVWAAVTRRRLAWFFPSARARADMMRNDVSHIGRSRGRIDRMDMNFGMRAENRKLLERVATMVRDEIMPLEAEYQAEVATGDRWQYTARQTEILEGLKAKAKAQPRPKAAAKAPPKAKAKAPPKAKAKARPKGKGKAAPKAKAPPKLALKKRPAALKDGNKRPREEEQGRKGHQGGCGCVDVPCAEHEICCASSCICGRCE